MATKKTCCDRSRDRCSHLMYQSSLETQTAVSLGDMVYNKPKSSQYIRPLSQSSEALCNGLKRLSSNGPDNGEITEHQHDDQEATCAHSQTRTVVNGDTEFLNGGGDKDHLLTGSHGKHNHYGRDRYVNCICRPRYDSDSYDGGKEEEECLGEDEHDGIVTDLIVHTKHFVRSFFGKSFFRFHREHSTEKMDDSKKARSVMNNILVPGPFQNGFACLGIHIEQEEMGLRIVHVFSDSLACKAHLKESDILTHLDDKELTNQELDDIRGMFRGVQKAFKLTIWREIHEGTTNRWTQLTIKISITETVCRSFEIEVIVSRAPIRPMPASTQCHFITKDPDGGHQIYMHYDDDGSLNMSELVHEDPGCIDRASFYFDFYFCSRSQSSTILGQLCTLRHRTTNHGDKVFNCTTGLMESLPSGHRDMRIYLLES
eukprot:XP_011670571.1 PREDICTED: uncharacterized protein LOC105441282 [Strongylocentrotus purpuratus]